MSRSRGGESPRGSPPSAALAASSYRNVRVSATRAYRPRQQLLASEDDSPAVERAKCVSQRTAVPETRKNSSRVGSFSGSLEETE